MRGRPARLRYARFNDRPLGYGSGNRHVLSAQIIDMQIDSRPDQVQHLIARLTNRYASRQVRYVRAPAGFTLFDDNEILHVLILRPAWRL